MRTRCASLAGTALAVAFCGATKAGSPTPAFAWYTEAASAPIDVAGLREELRRLVHDEANKMLLQADNLPDPRTLDRIGISDDARSWLASADLSVGAANETLYDSASRTRRRYALLWEAENRENFSFTGSSGFSDERIDTLETLPSAPVNDIDIVNGGNSLALTTSLAALLTN